MAPWGCRQEQSRVKTMGKMGVPGIQWLGVLCVYIAVEEMSKKGTKKRREKSSVQIPKE